MRTSKGARNDYFPANRRLQLPIGLSILILIGLFALAARRASPGALTTVLAAVALFMLVLISRLLTPASAMPYALWPFSRS